MSSTRAVKSAHWHEKRPWMGSRAGVSEGGTSSRPMTVSTAPPGDSGYVLVSADPEEYPQTPKVANEPINKTILSSAPRADEHRADKSVQRLTNRTPRARRV